MEYDVYRAMYADLADHFVALGYFDHSVALPARGSRDARGVGVARLRAQHGLRDPRRRPDGARRGVRRRAAPGRGRGRRRDLPAQRGADAAPRALADLQPVHPRVRRRAATTSSGTCSPIPPRTRTGSAYEDGRAVGMNTFMQPFFLSPMTVPEKTIYLFQGIVTQDARAGGVGTRHPLEGRRVGARAGLRARRAALRLRRTCPARSSGRAAASGPSSTACVAASTSASPGRTDELRPAGARRVTMRSLARPAGAIALVSVLLLSSHSGAAAFGARLKMSSYYGRASATFQFTYTLNRLPGDGPCPMADLALTWDGEALGSVPLDCATLSASGAVTPPADANALGNHQFCVGNESKGALLLCVPYTIVPEPGQCDPTGNTSPPCVAATTTPFEPDCVPTGRPSSPPCVTVTPIPIDCGNPSSPPCAETPAPDETATPTCQVAPGAPWCPTATPRKRRPARPRIRRPRPGRPRLPVTRPHPMAPPAVSR